ncbi:MAG: prephenate dehydrogenase/arogenate dehydrogenase family protein [Synergistaceae bacterium]|jgi:prephenate dehydrogenase|nr:prephenate dehydrogenase/arogenate dehydrogenase family protein [Synergistaceae bacterium]
MKIGIVGLGLIGGSLAKAYKKNSDHVILGYDKAPSVVEFARIYGAVDSAMDKNNIGECEALLIAINPKDTVEFLNEHASLISPKTLVIDCCGTKRIVCGEGFRLAKEHGFIFIGGHPMAGTHKSGFANSSEDLFTGAPMVLVPHVFDDIQLLERAKKVLEPIGFGFLHVTTAEKHDNIVSFTSQLAHVVSNAYIKSPTAREHKGVSAGSYKDLTRVAWLDPGMWADLFINNKDNLLRELDFLISSLSKYRDALDDEDFPALRDLLLEGKKAKEEVDGQ